MARVNHEMVVERITRMKMVPKRVRFKFAPDEENLMEFYRSAASHSPERLHQIEEWYRELPVEAYCDRYAIKQIKKLFKKERRRIRWSVLKIS